MRLAIIGGGIGGLVTALALHQRGMEVDVYEAVREIRPLGVGINLLPHAIRVLESLGLVPALEIVAITTSSLTYVNRYGQTIWREARGKDAGYAWSQFSIHRGELQMLLLDAVRARIGGGRVHLGHRLEAFENRKDSIRLTFRSSDGAAFETDVDVAIAADGIHSTARKILYPNEGPAKYSGRMLWRAATLGEPFLDGRSMFMAGHQDQKFVAYPISERERRDGRSLVNWIAELALPGSTPAREDWNRAVPAERFAAEFRDWNFGWVDIPALIRGAKEIYEFPMVDRDPLPAWVSGRLALLGDAAHAMYPIGSNGASQAIIDADCLAGCLTAFADPHYALREYEAVRLPATAAIVLRNRLNGPEQVMQLVHERAPNGFTDIEAVIARKELEEIAARYKRVAGFDAQTLSQQTPRSRAD